MSDDLLHAVRDLPKVSPYLHVPAQCGSNDVLQRMKRRLHGRSSTATCSPGSAQRVPDAAVTSDFIVGFCGETEEDFQQTAIWCATPGSRTASFSSTAPGRAPRPTSCYADDVPEEVKRRRNNELLAIQNAISLEDNQPFLGRTSRSWSKGPSKVARRRKRGEGRGEGERGQGWGQGAGGQLARVMSTCNWSAGPLAIGSWCSTDRNGLSVDCAGGDRAAVDAFTLTGRSHRSSFLISVSISVVETLRLTTLPSWSTRIIVGTVRIPKALAGRLSRPPSSKICGQGSGFSAR